jgi:signal transduction histidine kinase/ligand-binding sensor domain-containing protein
MKKTLLLFLLLRLTGICFAQHNQRSEYYFNRLSVKNGLPEDVIMTILQDKEGYVWAGTQGGLIRYDGYNVRVYQFGETDPNNASVYTLSEDNKGGLWVGTWINGLFHYDRKTDRFIHYKHDPNDSNSIGKGTFKETHEDRTGNLWMILNTAPGKSYLTLFDIKKNQFKRFGNSEKGDHNINASDYSGLFEDRKGNMWVGSNNGLYEYAAAGDHFIPHFASSDSSNQIGLYNLTEDPAIPGVIWMSSWDIKKDKGEGLRWYNSMDNAVKDYRRIPSDSTSLGNDTICTIQKDSKGRMWFGTYNGLSIFNPVTHSFINYTIKDKKAKPWGTALFLFGEDKEGNFWCGNQQKLFTFNFKSKTFTPYSPNENNPDDLQLNGYNNLVIDRSGTPWVGTIFQGLNWLDVKRSKFTVYKNSPEKSHYFPGGGSTSFAENKDGTFWVWSANGLYHWYPSTDSFVSVNNLKDQGVKPAWHFSSITIDKQGIVWCNNLGKGLFNYNPKTHAIKNYRYNKDDSTSLSSDYISAVLEDHTGLLWIGTLGGGLCSFDPKTNNFRRYPFIKNERNTPNHNALDDETVFDIYEDKQGTIWVGTNLGGLNRLNRETGAFTSYQNQIPGFMTISNIFEDNGGNLWSATHLGGLVLFDRKTNTSQKFTETDGLLYDGSFGINADNKNNLWVTSQRGISILNSQTHSFSRLDLTNGLPELPENNLNFFKASDGRLFMPCNNGFISFDPAQLKADSVPPIIHIESVEIPIAQISGQKQTDSVIYTFGKDKIKLHYDENRISFNYIGLQYQNSALNQYAYKLDGYDKDWIQAGTLRKVTYTNLSPGTYTFHVKAANSDGVWNPEEKTIAVIISPPWWFTWWAYVFYALLVAGAIWAFVDYRAKSLKRENVVLEEKIALRTNQLKQSLEDLKSTQTQLIQSEKMASLGELTAGIAHEIQNPLNFVNNFSDVNTELLDELKAESLKPKAERNDQVEEELLDNIKTNEQKINHHGKRADAIVKGMLLHSRSSASAKEPTDLNALAEEYLRLSYHGLRARDKTFNATTQTNFDETIGKINIVPQEIGRVLLNLINNGLYAVAEKKKQQGNGYEPKVSVTTKKIGDHVEIIVRDNGNGITAKIADKIFQPFFTTKPAGQGTGLGLSLSYDMVKAHGGEIKMETQAGEGTAFTVVLPKNG